MAATWTPPLVCVEGDREQVGSFAGEPVLVLVEADEQHSAAGRQRPRRRGGGEQAEGDDVADEFVDAGAAGRGLQGEDAVALAGDLAQLGADLQGDVGVGDDARGAQAAADSPVGGAAGLLAEDERERAIATEALFLVQDGDVVAAQRLLEAVAGGVAVQRCDPKREVVDLPSWAGCRASGTNFGHADRCAWLGPGVFDGVLQPQPGVPAGRRPRAASAACAGPVAARCQTRGANRTSPSSPGGSTSGVSIWRPLSAFGQAGDEREVDRRAVAGWAKQFTGGCAGCRCSAAGARHVRRAARRRRLRGSASRLDRSGPCRHRRSRSVLMTARPTRVPMSRRPRRRAGRRRRGPRRGSAGGRQLRAAGEQLSDDRT